MSTTVILFVALATGANWTVSTGPSFSSRQSCEIAAKSFQHEATAAVKGARPVAFCVVAPR
jgi:hypothetical protein